MSDVTLMATDLDRTLIYSRAASGPAAGPLVVVERYRDEDASFMQADAADRYAVLHRHATVVPTTTRTPQQWRRITLPGPPPRYAVAANGGVLLTDGAVDRPWTRTVTAALAHVAPLAEVLGYAQRVCDPDWTSAVRNAEGLFCYAVLDRQRMPADLPSASSAWARERGWRVSLQGRKLYWVPEPLTKSAAVAEVARRVGASTLLAAGDSLLDLDLLAAADAGIMARHGELAASGWRSEQVRITAGCGVRAGAEIVDWFAAQIAETAGR